MLPPPMEHRIRKRVVDSQTIEDTAARWVLKRAAQEWTSTDADALEVWLDESTLHRVAFLRLDTVWHQMARMKALGAGVPAGVIPPPGYWNSVARQGGAAAVENRRPRTSPTRWYGVAATFALAVFAGWVLLFARMSNEVHYSTPVGGLQTFTLRDGSRLTLNTDSAARVHFDRGQRRIDLDSGEAYFVAARDPSRPFTVFVANSRITALGTEFSVRRNPSSVQVIVAEGRVQLSTSGAAAPSAADSFEAGTVALVRGADISTRHASELDLDALLSWRNGFIVLRDTPLAEAVAEFNRFHARKIVLGDASIGELKVSGKFRPTNAEAFLWLLEKGFPVTVEQRKESIVINRRP